MQNSSKKQRLIPVLAKKFLLSRASDGFLSFVSLVSVVGVALGVLALTVVTSAVNGFEGELIRGITGLNGDVILYTRASPFDDHQELRTKIRSVLPQVEGMTPSFVTELMVSGPHGVGGAVFEGVDLSSISEVTRIPDQLIQGRMPEAGVAEVTLGSALAEKIGALVGTRVRLIAPFAGENFDNESTLGDPKVVEAEVVGILKLGMYQYDSKYVFSSLPFVQSFLNEKDRITTFKLKLSAETDLEQAANQLSDSFGYPFRAKYWGQLNKNLLYAIQLEKAVIAILLTAIIVVAAFNVVSTLMMMIHDKVKEISILKAMGFRRSQTFRLFCSVGMLIGVVGVASGLGLGLLVNGVLSRTRWIHLPADVYYIDFLPVVVRWGELGLIALFALLISFAATLYPSFRVSNQSPLDGLRYEE